jgi:hypothetical protein
MKRLLTSVATMGVTLVAAGGLFAGLATTASAAPVPPWETGTGVDPDEAGALLLFDSSGNPVTGGSINSPIAAFAQGTAVLNAGDTAASLYGYLPKNGVAPGAWAGEVLAGPSSFPNSSAPAPVSHTLPVVQQGAHDLTVADLAGDFANTDTSNDGYAGLYQLRLFTAGDSGQSAEYDSADIQITGSTWSVVYPAVVSTPTTTVLTVAPSSPQTAGTSLTLTATVSPTAAGTVQFEDGATNLGAPVTVAGGVATTSTSSLAAGTHALHAVFSPTSSAFAGSTGDATFVVSPAPAGATTTALSINPTSGPVGTTVTLTGAVTSGGSAVGASVGSVKFFDNFNGSNTLIGSATVGAGGIASTSYSSFALGDHPDITAQFVSSNTAVLASSAVSSAVDFNSTAPTTPTDQQSVKVEIPAGSLTISSPYTPSNPFDLGTAVLDANDSKFTATAPFGDTTKSDSPTDNGGVSITDTQAGDQDWTASATVSDFTDGTDTINGQNLTFTNVTPVYIPGNALQAGSVHPTDVTNSAIYAAGAAGTDGLKGPAHTIANSTNGGEGSVYIDGTLTLTAPTSTPNGAYTATLTFTVA